MNHPAPRWLKLGLLAIVVVITLWQGWYAGWVLWWKWFDPQTTSFQSQRLGELREKNPNAELKKQWLAYAKISNNLKRAVIAAEDDKFVDHEGFDWEGIQKAIEKNQQKGKVVAGGSARAANFLPAVVKSSNHQRPLCLSADFSLLLFVCLPNQSLRDRQIYRPRQQSLRA